MADYTVANQNILVHRTRDALIRQKGNADFVRQYLDLLSLDMVSWDDDFLGDIIATQYTTNSNAGTALALSAGAKNGAATMVTAGTNNDDAVATLGLHYYGTHNAIMYAIVHLSSIAAVKCEVGFKDNITSANGADASAAAVVSVLATPDSTAVDGACWVFDTDDTGSWQAFGVKNNGTPSKVEPTYLGNFDGDAAPNASVYELLLVALQGSSARFYRGSMSGKDSSEGDFTKRLTITYDSGWQADYITSTADVTPYVLLQTRTAGAKTMTVDRFGAYQYRHSSEGTYTAA